MPLATLGIEKAKRGQLQVRTRRIKMQNLELNLEKDSNSLCFLTFVAELLRVLQFPVTSLSSLQFECLASSNTFSNKLTCIAQ